MNSKPRNPIDDELLASYLSGEMNRDTEIEFESKFAASEQAKQDLNNMKTKWNKISHLSDQPLPDASRAWAKLQERLIQDDLVPEQKNRYSGSFPDWSKAAAVILLLITAGTLLYLNFNRKTPAQLVQLISGNPTNTLVKSLNDGSIVYLSQNSQISYPQEFAANSRKIVMSGEAFFDVAHNPEKPFIIETGDVVVQVLGTAFNVNAPASGEFELKVDRGKVKVSSKIHPERNEIVVAGEKISVTADGFVKAKFNEGAGEKWYQQKMHFKDETLATILRVLNANYNTNFATATQKTAEQQLTVTFVNQNTDTLTELICATLNLKSKTINGIIVFSENPDAAVTK